MTEREQMDKLLELRQSLGAAADDYKRLANELQALIDDETAFNTKKIEVEKAAAKIDRCKSAVASAEAAQAQQSALARPVNPGQARITLPAAARVRYSGLKAFKDRNVDGTLVTAEEQAYRMGQFVLASVYGIQDAKSWCQENGIVLTRAQSEGVNSAGGFLVPEEMMASIIDLREQYGVFRQQAQIVPMGRDTLYWPRRTGGVTAYFVSEGIAATESQASWDSVNLTAKKMAALIRLSTEIAEDAIINVADWIVNEIAYAFAVKEDDCGFNGDGTSTYGGITGATTKFLTATAGVYTATGHATFGVLDNVDITALMGKLPFYALPNAKFYCSQFAFSTVFERLVAIAGGNSINTLDGSVVYRYLGFPIVISQKLPLTATPTGLIAILFGDLRRAAALGERRQVTILRSDQRYIDTDQIGIFGNQRIDINVHDVGDTVNPGPLVALKMG